MNTTSMPQGYTLTKGFRRYVFSLLFLLYFFDYVDRMIVTSLFPFIKADWGLSDAQCGMLVSAVYWSIVVFTFPASILVDRWSRKKSIGIMGVLWSFATAACAFAGTFGHLFAARTAIGIGEAGYAPGGTAMISGLYPEEKRSRMMGLWNASIPLGCAVGIAVGGVVATHWGWRHAFGLVAIPGFIVSILVFFIKDYKTVELLKTVENCNNSQEKVKMKAGDIVKEFMDRPSLILTYIGFTGMTFVTASLMTWLPTYFHRVHHLSESQAGVKAGIVMALALFGAPLGGLVADLWSKKRSGARLLVATISALASALFLFVGFKFFEGNVQYIFLLLMGLSVVAFVPAAAAVTQDVVHPGLRASSYAICVVVQNMIGAALGPIYVGFLSDMYGIQTALLSLPVFLIFAGVLFFIGSFFYGKDLDKVEKIKLVAEQ